MRSSPATSDTASSLLSPELVRLSDVVSFAWNTSPHAHVSPLPPFLPPWQACPVLLSLHSNRSIPSLGRFSAPASLASPPSSCAPGCTLSFLPCWQPACILPTQPGQELLEAEALTHCCFRHSSDYKTWHEEALRSCPVTSDDGVSLFPLLGQSSHPWCHLPLNQIRPSVQHRGRLWRASHVQQQWLPAGPTQFQWVSTEVERFWASR